MSTPSAVPNPGDTEWVVIRPEGELEFTELTDTYDGQWRRRTDLVDDSAIEMLTPDGTVRAFPTSRIEQSPAGDLAQVYEVPQGDSEDDGD